MMDEPLINHFITADKPFEMLLSSHLPVFTTARLLATAALDCQSAVAMETSPHCLNAFPQVRPNSCFLF